MNPDNADLLVTLSKLRKQIEIAIDMVTSDMLRDYKPGEPLEPLEQDEMIIGDFRIRPRDKKP